MKSRGSKRNVTIQFKDSDKGYKQLGQAIKIMRKSRKVSQNELGNRTNRDRTGLSAYERCVATPTLYALQDISAVLNYDMELNFKEVIMLDREIVTKEYVECFMNEAKNKKSLAYSVLKRIDAIDKKWVITELEKNHMMVSFESDKWITIKVNGRCNNPNKVRFIPIYIEAKGEEDGQTVYYTWRYYEDAKEDGFSDSEIKEIMEYVHDCYALGELYSLSRDLDDRLEGRLDIQKIKSCLFDSYSLLKIDYNLKDDEILDIVLETFGADLNNFFVGVLKSSSQPEREFTKRKYELINKLTEICEKEDIKASEDVIYSIFTIAYCIKFANAALSLIYEGSDPWMGDYICSYENGGESDEWGEYIVNPYIIDEIDLCMKELSEVYTEESSVNIIELILNKGVDFIDCEDIAYYIDKYREECVNN